MKLIVFNYDFKIYLMQLILPINWETYQIKFSKFEINWDANETVAMI